jgi:acyl dehydratase
MEYKYYWEDFVAGDRRKIGARRIEQDEMIEFAKQYDPQPFHVDPEAAQGSFFGGLIASGWQTCGIVMRIMCDAYLNESASLGSPGLDNIRWSKPVRPGDTLEVEREILESRVSNSKPDIGIVKTRWIVTNQDGEVVMTMEGFGMFRRRHPGRAN